jgi:hypothetical protein
MPDGYIFEAKDVKGEFLAYFIAHEPDLIKAQNLVRSISMAETVELVKNLDMKGIINWQEALKTHPSTQDFDLASGTCLDLATWAHT